MIEVKNLTKRYGAKSAVDNISFTVGEGEILGFLGPNGAGKSTTMNIITGYSSSTAGTVTIGGAEILDDPIKVKSQIGYLPEHPPLYLDMTVKEYLSFMYDLKKVKLAGVSKNNHIAEICELVKITDVYNRIIKNLSKGYRQRVGLAQALLGNPSVLVLDEPTVGLDPKQIIEIRNLIKGLGKKHTII
jgi:ABC-2 type transport system ATP-binding protein